MELEKLMRNLVSGGGGQSYLLDEKDRVELLKNVKKQIKKLEKSIQVDPVETVGMCADIGTDATKTLFPCDPNVPGDCPDPVMYRPGGALAKEPFAKFFQEDLVNGKRYRCVPRGLKGSGTVSAKYTDSDAVTSGDDTMDNRLVELNGALRSIRVNLKAMERRNKDLHIALTEDAEYRCDVAKTSREACEKMLLPRGMGKGYGDRCHFRDTGDASTCSPKLTGQVFRRMTSLDVEHIRGEVPINKYTYDIDEQKWVDMQEVESSERVFSNRDIKAMGPNGNAREILMSGDEYIPSIAVTMMRVVMESVKVGGGDGADEVKSGDDAEAKKKTQDMCLVALFNAVIGRDN